MTVPDLCASAQRQAANGVAQGARSARKTAFLKPVACQGKLAFAATPAPDRKRPPSGGRITVQARAAAPGAWWFWPSRAGAHN